MNSVRNLAVAITTTALACGPARGALITCTYTGPDGGNWNTAGNWSCGAVPDNGGGNTYEVIIDSSAANKTVILDVSPVINKLTVNAGDTLSFNDDADLAVVVGPIANNGLISLNSTGSNTSLLIGANLSLTGSGTLQMSGNANNVIRNNFAGTPLLTNAAGHTIRGAGQIGADSLNILNNGSIIADQATALVIDPTTTTLSFENRGLLRVSGAGGMTIEAGSFFNRGQAIIDSTRTLTRSGDYVQDFGPTSTTLVNGTLTVTGPISSVDLHGGSVLKGSGTVNAPGGLFNFHSRVEPGESVGILTINGNYTQTGGNGRLKIEIGGPTPGTGHDQLVVTGTAHLLGLSVLEVELINEFKPEVGQTFTILSAGARNGQFDPVIAPPNLCVLYQGNNVLVRVETSPAPGDISCNGVVDVDDLLFVINDWGPYIGSCPPTCIADVAPPGGDCVVNVDDLLLVINSWGPTK